MAEHLLLPLHGLVASLKALLFLPVSVPVNLLLSFENFPSEMMTSLSSVVVSVCNTSFVSCYCRRNYLLIIFCLCVLDYTLNYFLKENLQVD